MAKKKQQSTQSDTQTIDFETSLQEVEAIVEQLESGNLGLSESLGQYEQGIAKIKLCHQVLERAEQKILLLTQVDEDGTPHTESVEPTETSGESTKTTGTRAKRKKRDSDNVDDLGGLF
ncbi:exodeoxyribonuclease VII small subunit [Rhodopirellula sp. MGV]|uniref:exodeoxyribonuclease VII small subunit n=1 Tax=Rhodopirellula sp. MGV TaxID=2023130 RepID=UPI000B96D6D4|nr:exodeoxyribonuclease VII small subunit [Rhodopirellula sp. MGV]OYP38136.1 exodeoxyribonuclease VII small subunit [Rhodopirellula sp. MGV]PNY38472.1 exodeoxyribonuclease VII small subunit [Rhodopirellula baltica]